MKSGARSNRILVTGGTGFIGANLVGHLNDLGEFSISVVDIAAPSTDDPSHAEDVKVIRGDILDPEFVAEAIDGVNCIVHLAADTRVMDSIADPNHNFETNVVGTFRLLQAARDAGVERFINASTGGAVLGEQTPPVNETMVPEPIAPYGASKLSAEGYCSAFAGAFGMANLSLRFSNIYGPLSLHKESVVAHFFKAILAGREIVVYGDGSQVRDYLYVGDLVAGIAAAIRSDVIGILQLGSGRPTPLDELIDEIRRVVGDGYPIEVRYAEPRKGEIHSTWCDITKAEGLLGFSPGTSLREGLGHTWKWFLKAHQPD